MRDSLDQYFPIGICAYKPERGLFVKLGPHRYIMVDFYEKSVRVKDGPYNLMLHCEHEQPLDCGRQKAGRRAVGGQQRKACGGLRKS